jgi:hypothetical protein
MERLADLRSSDVPPGSGQTRQHKRWRWVCDLEGEDCVMALFLAQY